MAVVYIERAGIKFSLEDGRRVTALADKSELSGLVFVTEAGYKKYPSAPERLAHKVYKDKSYIIDGNTVYFYKAQDLEELNANVSPYQILINNFLKNKRISGNILLVDGGKDAVIVSLIINEEFKQTLISNSKVINETLAEIKKDISKEKIKLDKVIINDEFYVPVFKNINPQILNSTEILEFAQGFNAPVFKKIEDIRKKLKIAQDKKLNFILAITMFIFTISTGAYLYTAHINNEYTVLNNNLRMRLSGLKQKLNIEIEKKFLTKVRVDVAKDIRFTLSNISAVPNIKINTLTVAGKRFIITGNILGGYRSFVRGYNSLKEKALKIGGKANYTVSSTGKTGFNIKGNFK